MTVIDKARELGVMIQQDERYAAYYAAKDANDNDETLQNMINEFNMKRMQLNSEMSKEQRDDAKIAQIKEREYCQSLEEYHGNLLLVGVNYDLPNDTGA